MLISLLDKNLLETALVSKFSNQLLTAIVSEAFVNGLPFDQKDLTNDDRKSLTKYTGEVLESLGGFNAISKAKHEALIADDILEICKESATEAACRVCKEEITGPNNTKTLPEVVDDASFTKDEYDKFVKSADHMDLDKVSDIIKDKVIGTIKSEKDEYEKQTEVETELKDAISDNPDVPKDATPAEDDDKKDDNKDEECDGCSDDSSLDSYMDIVLNKSDPRSHITLFSKLQDVSANVISNTYESFTNIPYKTLNMITFENFLGDLHKEQDIDTAIESLGMYAAATECDQDCQKPDLGNTSLICTVVVYTVLETLKTLGLYTPPASSVRTFVDRGSNEDAQSHAEFLKAKMERMIDDIKRADESATTTDRTAYFDELTSIKESALSITNPEFDTAKDEIAKKADEAINIVAAKLSAAVEAANTVHTPSQWDLQKKELTIAQFNKLNNIYGSNPNVRKIVLKYNPAMESSMDIDCKDGRGSVIDSGFIEVNYSPVFGSFVDFVKEAYGASNLVKSSKKVDIYYTDGSSKLIEL